MPNADVDPTPFATLASIVMFGVMFADAGHGLLMPGTATDRLKTPFSIAMETRLSKS